MDQSRPPLLMQHLNYMAEKGLIELQSIPHSSFCPPKAKITKDGLAHIKSNLQLIFENAWVKGVMIGIITTVAGGLIFRAITK